LVCGRSLTSPTFLWLGEGAGLCSPPSASLSLLLASLAPLAPLACRTFFLSSRPALWCL
jgi:hypothetical protein